MGGGAMLDTLGKDVKISRLTLKLRLRIKLLVMCFSVSNNLNITFLRDAPEKTSFGDLDIVYVEKDNFNLRNELKNSPIFGKYQLITRKSCTTTWIAYKLNGLIYEIEFLPVKADNLKFTLFYKSFSIVGQMFGLMMADFGLKFGNDGFYLCFTKNDIKYYMNEHGYTQDQIAEYKINEDLKIMLITSPEEFSNFVGVSFEQWVAGFSTEFEFFHWFTTCKFFRLNSFKFVDERTSLHGRFYDYVSKLESTNNQICCNVLDFKLKMLNDFSKTFVVENEIKNALKNYERKQKFNFLIVKFQLDQFCQNNNLPLYNDQVMAKLLNNLKVDMLEKLKIVNFNDFLDTMTNDQILSNLQNSVCDVVNKYNSK